MSKTLLAALCALPCLLAGPAMADSSASAKEVRGSFRFVEVVDLRPDDDTDPEHGAFTKTGYGVLACLESPASNQCVTDQLNSSDDPNFAELHEPFGDITASNSAGLFGSVATPSTGANTFSGVAGWSYGSGVGPWTQITIEATVELHAAGDAFAYATLRFAGSESSSFVYAADLEQGARTLSLTVSNPSDQWVTGMAGVHLTVYGTAAAVPEPSAHALLALGALLLYARRRMRP